MSRERALKLLQIQHLMRVTIGLERAGQRCFLHGWKDYKKAQQAARDQDEKQHKSSDDPPPAPILLRSRLGNRLLRWIGKNSSRLGCIRWHRFWKVIRHIEIPPSSSRYKDCFC